MLTLLSGHLVHVEARLALYEPGRQAVVGVRTATAAAAATVSGSVFNRESQQQGGWVARMTYCCSWTRQRQQTGPQCKLANDGTRMPPHSQRRHPRQWARCRGWARERTCAGQAGAAAAAGIASVARARARAAGAGAASGASGALRRARSAVRSAGASCERAQDAQRSSGLATGGQRAGAGVAALRQSRTGAVAAGGAEGARATS